MFFFNSESYLCVIHIPLFVFTYYLYPFVYCMYVRINDCHCPNAVVLLRLFPSLAFVVFLTMDETKFEQLVSDLDAARHWQCQLMFPAGSTDAVNLCEYLQRFRSNRRFAFISLY